MPSVTLWWALFLTVGARACRDIRFLSPRRCRYFRALFRFNPPQWLLDMSSQIALFIWLSAWTIISRAILTLFNVPHLALGGELSKDQQNGAAI